MLLFINKIKIRSLSRLRPPSRKEPSNLVISGESRTTHLNKAVFVTVSHLLAVFTKVHLIDNVMGEEQWEKLDDMLTEAWQISENE